jgi:hypothetical protein
VRAAVGGHEIDESGRVGYSGSERLPVPAARPSPSSRIFNALQAVAISEDEVRAFRVSQAALNSASCH